VCDASEGWVGGLDWFDFAFGLTDIQSRLGVRCFTDQRKTQNSRKKNA
jgi:hypothetical protein